MRPGRSEGVSFGLLAAGVSPSYMTVQIRFAGQRGGEGWVKRWQEMATLACLSNVALCSLHSSLIAPIASKCCLYVRFPHAGILPSSLKFCVCVCGVFRDLHHGDRIAREIVGRVQCRSIPLQTEPALASVAASWISETRQGAQRQGQGSAYALHESCGAECGSSWKDAPVV